MTKYLPLCAVIMILTAIGEYSMGRLPFCKCGVIRLWSGNIWSNQNSQQLTDPYTFTHILHGVLFYALLWLVCGKRAPATISLDYYGDSILNSMGDILAMTLGFELARRLPVRVCAIGAIVVDLILLWWIRDNLTINIIMLIHPIEAIKHWQQIR
jgi:hypothetical protein